MNTPPAIAVLELGSIAAGTEAADAMVKRAPVQLLSAGTVQPGKYIILVSGAVAAVEESYAEGLRRSGDALSDSIILPDVHQQVYDSLGGLRRPNDNDALGIIETSAIPSNVRAADRAVKAAHVTLVEIRLGDGLGGKGVTTLTGKIHDIQAAVEAALASISDASITVRSVIIPAQHQDVRHRVENSTWFAVDRDHHRGA